MANNDFFLVNFDGLDGITQTLVSQYQTLQTSFEDMKTQVPATLSSWMGGASQEYQSAQNQLESLLGEMGAVLGMAGQHTGTAHDTWLGAELDNIRRWAGL